MIKELYFLPEGGHSRTKWKEIYDAYYSSMCSYSCDILNDAGIAKDVVQDTFVNIWKSRLCFETEKDFIRYIYKAVYKNSLYYLRSHANRIKRETIPDIFDDPEYYEALSAKEELIRRMYCQINKLPESRRKIIELSLKGLSGDEIADILGISINTIKTQKQRGYKFLAETLKKYLVF